MKRKEITAYFLYILLGALWSLSNVGYVKYFGSAFAWFTLSFFIYFIQRESIKNGIKFSIVFGFTAYIVHFWWMAIPMIIVMGSSLFPDYIAAIALFIGFIVTIGVSFFHGLIYTFTYRICKYISFGRKEYFYLSFALFGTVIDYFYPKLWHDYLGYSQFNNHLLMQSVDLFGISFISMIVISFNSLLAYLIDCYVSKLSLRKPLIMISIFVLFIGCLNFYGSKRINKFEKLVKYSNSKKIALIQGNNSGLDKRDPDRSERMLADYNELSKSILKEKPDLIVWPESSIPMWFSDDIEDFNYIKKFYGIPLLFGTHYREYNDTSYDIYNAMILTDRNGRKVDTYKKNKLLAFTEEVPVRGLGFIMPLIGLKEFSRGEGPTILKSGDDIYAAVNICYESIIPDYIRKSMSYKDMKANVIINGTNDSWFGATIQPEMHLRIASTRAIENRRYLIRATCTGYSVVVDAVGNIVYRSELYKPEAFVYNTPLLSEDTLFIKGGYLFIYFLLIIGVVIFIVVWVVKYSGKKKEKMLLKRKLYEQKLKNIWLN